MRRSRCERVLAAYLAASLASCGWKVTPPKPPPGGMVRKVASRVVLRVDDSAVVWGGGQLGEVVRDTLRTVGAFDDVAYPVEPRTPTPLHLSIAARGAVDEEVALGMIKAIFIGLLFMLPVGIVRFGKTFELDATVVLVDAGQELRRFQVQTRTHVSHTTFSHSNQYEPEARRVAFRDLGERIAIGLSSITVPPVTP
jgi:hypothetical protein